MYDEMFNDNWAIFSDCAGTKKSLNDGGGGKLMRSVCTASKLIGEPRIVNEELKEVTSWRNERV